MTQQFFYAQNSHNYFYYVRKEEDQNMDKKINVTYDKAKAAIEESKKTLIEGLQEELRRTEEVLANDHKDIEEFRSSRVNRKRRREDDNEIPRRRRWGGVY